MPLISVSTPTAHEPFEIRLSGGEAIYTISPNVHVTTYVEKEHLATLTTAIQSVVAGAVVTARPE